MKVRDRGGEGCKERVPKSFSWFSSLGRSDPGDWVVLCGQWWVAVSLAVQDASSVLTSDYKITVAAWG